MNKLYIPILSFLFLISTNSVSASLVNVTPSGEVIVNVLAEEDSVELEIPRSEGLAVKDVVEVEPNPKAKLSLARNDGRVALNISTNGKDDNLDVSDYTGEIIHIEERPEVNRVAIGLTENGFSISEKGVTAVTEYEINVDPEKATLTLLTPSGSRFLSILPKQALDTVLRSKTLTIINSNGEIKLSESSDGGLQYAVGGEKHINLFNLLDLPIDVTAYVSASTGEIISVDQPQWLPVLNILFG